MIPAGTEVVGHVTGFTETRKSIRVEKILSGNFGSFRHAEIVFDTVLQKNGPALKINASTESENIQVVEMRARRRMLVAAFMKPSSTISGAGIDLIQRAGQHCPIESWHWKKDIAQR